MQRTSGVKKVYQTRYFRISMVTFMVFALSVLSVVVIYQIAVNDTKLSSTITNVTIGVFILIEGKYRPVLLFTT